MDFRCGTERTGALGKSQHGSTHIIPAFRRWGQVSLEIKVILGYKFEVSQGGMTPCPSSLPIQLPLTIPLSKREDLGKIHVDTVFPHQGHGFELCRPVLGEQDLAE